MLRKSHLLLALVSLSLVPLASQAADICCYPDCDYAVEYPYMGVMLSAVQIKSALNVRFPRTGTVILNDGTEFSNTGVTGGIAFGYAARWSGSWYFAAEVSSQPVFVSSSKTWTGNTGFVYNNNLKFINFFNADALPGYYITQHMLMYLRAGIAVSSMQMQQNNFFGNNFSTRNTAAGFRAGIGLDYSFTRRWSTGLDYVYTNYGTQKFDYNVPIPGGVSSSRTSARVYTNMIGLHFNYKFV